jgi:hypothetical protein
VLGAPPGEGVEPAPAVVEVPERDPGNRAGVPAEEAEQLGVLVGLAPQQVGRAAAGEWVGLRDLRAVLAPPRPTRRPGEAAI